MSTPASRVMQLMRREIHGAPMRGIGEIGTVVSAVPLLITLDFDRDIQLSYEEGNIILADNLILAPGDQVVLIPMVKRYQYAVLMRIGGDHIHIDLGRPGFTSGVALGGDILIIGAGTNANGHIHTGTIAQNSRKVRAE